MRRSAAEMWAPGKWRRMPSGAGHDAQCMAARAVLAAMLFVPSVGGVSHHWSEDAQAEDLAMRVQVLVGGRGSFH